MPIQIGNTSNDEGAMPGSTISPNLHLPILDSSQYIILSDTGQHSTRMRCYFHCECSHFIDYFDDPVLDDMVIYAGDVPFWYNEHEGIYTSFSVAQHETFSLLQVVTMTYY